MWSDLPVEPVIQSCTPPFSFYFDLIGTFWRHPDSNTLPFHRICTLARKQGAVCFVLESATTLARVREEIDYLDSIHAGGGGAAEAFAVSFFSQDLTSTDIADLPADAFLGQAIIINYRPPGAEAFSRSYVYEAILPPPRLPAADGGGLLLNNYLVPQKSFQCEVRGRTFEVTGIYYSQQNEATHVCAHACLRMAVTAGGGDITAKQINQLVQQTPPCEGLKLGDLVAVLEDRGFETDITNCEGISREEYLSHLASIVESGDQALLVFTTGNSPADHVILVYGHTRHSDEWHPQAMSLYAGVGSAEYLRASAWIDHYLVHDDNLGPYYTLSGQALDLDPDIRLRSTMAIRRRAPNLSPLGAEALAAVMLTNMLEQVKSLGSGRWFDYITSRRWRFVLRTILTTREDYIAHLAAVAGHDGTAMSPAELEELAQLPDRIWMVEFSLPALFTGNRSKLGEVLLAADPVEPEEYEDVFAGLRLPSLMLVKNADGETTSTACSLTAHAPIFRRTTNGQEW